MKTIFWDFDGTLVQSSPLWRGSMINALDKISPGHGIQLAHLTPYVSSGFPWHSDVHHNRTDPRLWWKYMEEKFERDFISLGIDPEKANSASKLIRDGILHPQFYFIFPEVPEVLERLKAKGWNHVVLSNNHPDLEHVLDSLNLLSHFRMVISSAYVGCEKPDPKIFLYAIQQAGAETHEKWMVGDNPRADIEGAAQVGIRGILVRNPGDHTYKARDLNEVEAILEKTRI